MEYSTESCYWHRRVVLVTGATGLLGSWLVRHLQSLRADVVCLVRDEIPTSLLWEPGFCLPVKIVRGGLEDRDLLERALGEHEVSTVFHLAAQTIVGIANRNPVSTFESNIAGTWNVLEACRRSPLVSEIVVASSDKAYGAQDVLPYREETPLQGSHPYDVSKSCADLIAQSYAHTYNLPVCITRCGNLFGGGDLNWNRLIPGTIRSILDGNAPIIRSNGQYERDYFYVEDAAEAYTSLAFKMAMDRTLLGSAFNFSQGRAFTALEVVETLLRLMQAPYTPIVENTACGEIEKQHLDSTKAMERLGWEAKWDLESGLQRTVAWYTERFGPSGGSLARAC